VSRFRRVGNLPAEISSFIDRRQEFAAVRKRLAVSRLVTLTGPGGVGKTRLAVHVARNLRRAYPAGVWLVDLADLRTGELVAHAVVEAAGIQGRADADPVDRLIAHWRERRVLLLLDNCEHVVEAAATFVAAVLEGTESVHVLATSREVLRVTGEHVVPVETWISPVAETSQMAAAVQLFAERARAVDPSFVLTTENTPTVEEICRQVDGLPLAIELAAVQLRVLSPQQILERADDQISLLVGGPRNVQARQRSLLATIEWSYQLCSPDEQALWSRGSVFSGSFALDEVEAVTRDGKGPTDPARVVDSLVGKSILVREAHTSHPRFRLPESLRQYGREVLRAGGSEQELLRRHAEWYLQLVEHGERTWFGPNDLCWLDRLRATHANLRAAVEYFLAERHNPGPVDPAPAVHGALRFVSALWFYWMNSGPVAEGWHWVRSALVRDPEPSPARAKALWVAAYLAFYLRQIDAAETFLIEARRTAITWSDDEALAWTFCWWAALALGRGDLERTRTCGEMALSLFRRLRRPDVPGPVVTQIVLAVGYVAQDNLAEAVRLGEVCRRTCVAHGEWTLRAMAELALARAAVHSETPETAVRHIEAVLTGPNEPGPSVLVFAVDLATVVAAATGQFERATVLLGALERLWQLYGPAFSNIKLFAEAREHAATQARRHVAAAVFDQLWETGRGLTSAEIVQYVLGRNPTKTQAARPARTGRLPGLTAREREVAELIGAGLTNRQISERLVISPRTAESHVEHVLQKLGFTSRTQVAAYVAGGMPDLTE
jgi:predicted ATPase/DNA-binding CsgD family transcriptional regulator